MSHSGDFDTPLTKAERDRWATHASAYDGGTRCGASTGAVGGIITCPDCLSILLPTARVTPPAVTEESTP